MARGWIGGAAGLAALATVAVFASTRPTEPPPVGDFDAELEELSATSQERLEPSPPRADGRGSERVSEPPSKPPVSPQDAAYKTVAALDAAFATEKADPEWAPDQEDRLRAIVTGNKVEGLTKLDVECRETMCRVGVTTGERFDSDVVDKLLFQPEFDTTCYTGPDPSRRVHAQIYASRAGTHLTMHPTFVEEMGG